MLTKRASTHKRTCSSGGCASLETIRMIPRLGAFSAEKSSLEPTKDLTRTLRSLSATSKFSRTIPCAPQPKPRTENWTLRLASKATSSIPTRSILERSPDLPCQPQPSQPSSLATSEEVGWAGLSYWVGLSLMGALCEKRVTKQPNQTRSLTHINYNWWEWCSVLSRTDYLFKRLIDQEIWESRQHFTKLRKITFSLFLSLSTLSGVNCYLPNSLYR